MNPGEYLKLRREAAGVPLDKIVGLQVPLDQTEADATRASFNDIYLLQTHFAFDFHFLALLLNEVDVPDICRICGCSFDDPCDPPCDWAEVGLCDNPKCLEKAEFVEVVL